MSNIGINNSSGLLLSNYIQTEFSNIIYEIRKKHLQIKEECEKCISWLKSLKDESTPTFQDANISNIIASSPDILKTLLLLAQAGSGNIGSMGTTSNSGAIPKALNTCLNCLHRISAQAPIPQSLFEEHVIGILKISSNSSEDSQLKGLQCILPIVTQQPNLSLNNLIQIFSICFTLHESKSLTVINAAVAIIRQLVLILFERISDQDEIKNNENVDYENSKNITNAHLILQDIFHLTSDHCQRSKRQDQNYDFKSIIPSIPNATGTASITTILPIDHIDKTFGFEIIESVLSYNSFILKKIPKFILLLKENLSPLIVKRLNEKNDFAIGCRLWRLICIFLKDYKSIMPLESKVIMSHISKIMLESNVPWEKCIVLEVLLELFSNFQTWTELQEICEQTQHAQIFREIVIAVNNLAFGEIESIHKSEKNNFASSNSATPATNAGTINSVDRKILSFSSLDMKIPLLSQFDKNQPPQIPDNYLLLKGWQILTRIVQTSLNSLSNQCFDSKSNSHIRRIKEELRGEFPSLSCLQLFEPTWGNVIRTFLSINSLGSLDSDYRRDISLNLVKFTALLGVLGFDAGVDLILSSLEEICRPTILSSSFPSSQSAISMSQQSFYQSSSIPAVAPNSPASGSNSNSPSSSVALPSQSQYSLGINDMIISTIVTCLSIALDMGELLNNSWYYIFKIMNTVDLLTIYKSRKIQIVTNLPSLMSPLTLSSLPMESKSIGTGMGMGMKTIGTRATMEKEIGSSESGVIIMGSPTPSHTSSPNLTEIDALAMSAQQSTTILEKSMFLTREAFEYFTSNLCKLSTEFLLHDKISNSKLPAALFLVQKVKQTLLLNMDRFIVITNGERRNANEIKRLADQEKIQKNSNENNEADRGNDLNQGSFNTDCENDVSLDTLLGHLRIDLSFHDVVIRELACESISLFSSQYINSIDRSMFQKSIILQMRVLKPLLTIEKESIPSSLLLSKNDELEMQKNQKNKGEKDEKLSLETPSPLASSSPSPLIYPETIKTILESLLKIIQTIGDYIIEGGWNVVLEILYHSMIIPKTIQSQSEKSQQSLSITKLVFSCIENICDAYLPILSLYNISNLVRSLSILTVQSNDLNIALTAIGLLWDISDYLSQKRSNENQYLMIWLECMEQFANISLDNRSELRNSAIQSLSRALNSQRSNEKKNLIQEGNIEKWNIILEKVLVRLLVEIPRKFHNYQSIEESNLNSNSSNSPSSSINTGSGNSSFILNSSPALIPSNRTSPNRQWEETLVLMLQGFSQIFHDILPISSFLTNFHGHWKIFLETIESFSNNINSMEMIAASVGCLEITLNPNDEEEREGEGKITQGKNENFFQINNENSEYIKEAEKCWTNISLNLKNHSNITTQHMLSTMVTIFHHIMTIRDKMVDLNWFNSSLKVLETLAKTSTLSESVKDGEKMTDLQSKILDYLEILCFKNHSEFIYDLVECLVGWLSWILEAANINFTLIPLTLIIPNSTLMMVNESSVNNEMEKKKSTISSGRKIIPPTFIALTVGILNLLQKRSKEWMEKREIYQNSKGFKKIIESIGILAIGKYSIPNGTNKHASIIWKLSTNLLKTMILEMHSHFSLLENKEEYWENLCEIFERILLVNSSNSSIKSSGESSFSSLSPLSSLSSPSLNRENVLKDEDYDIETMEFVCHSILPLLIDCVSDSLLERWLKAIERASNFYESSIDGNSVFAKPVYKQKLILSTIHNLFLVCSDGKREQTENQKQELKLKDFKIKEKLVSILIERCKKILKQFILEKPSMFNIPFPSIRIKELCVFLDEMMELKVKFHEKKYLKNEMKYEHEYYHNDEHQKQLNLQSQFKGHDLDHENENHHGKRGKGKKKQNLHLDQHYQSHEIVSCNIKELLLLSDRGHLFMIYDEIVQITAFKNEIELQKRIEKYYKLIGEGMELI